VDSCASSLSASVSAFSPTSLNWFGGLRSWFGLGSGLHGMAVGIAVSLALGVGLTYGSVVLDVATLVSGLGGLLVGLGACLGSVCSLGIAASSCSLVFLLLVHATALLVGTGLGSRLLAPLASLVLGVLLVLLVAGLVDAGSTVGSSWVHCGADADLGLPMCATSIVLDWYKGLVTVAYSFTSTGLHSWVLDSMHGPSPLSAQLASGSCAGSSSMALLLDGTGSSLGSSCGSSYLWAIDSTVGFSLLGSLDGGSFSASVSLFVLLHGLYCWWFSSCACSTVALGVG